MLRHTRETTDTTAIPTMKPNEITIPSGFSIMLSTRAYSRTRVTRPNPTVAGPWRRRRAVIVTAKAAETIMARIPVAYAPAWAFTSALNRMVMPTARAV